MLGVARQSGHVSQGLEGEPLFLAQSTHLLTQLHLSYFLLDLLLHATPPFLHIYSNTHQPSRGIYTTVTELLNLPKGLTSIRFLTTIFSSGPT